MKGIPIVVFVLLLVYVVTRKKNGKAPTDSITPAWSGDVGNNTGVTPKPVGNTLFNSGNTTHNSGYAQDHDNEMIDPGDGRDDTLPGDGRDDTIIPGDGRDERNAKFNLLNFIPSFALPGMMIEHFGGIGSAIAGQAQNMSNPQMPTNYYAGSQHPGSSGFTEDDKKIMLYGGVGFLVLILVIILLR